MSKILFLHGFFASGQCVPARALRQALEGRATVLSPDILTHPREALEQIRTIIEREKPDLLVLLGNPHFRMTEFLKQRVGEHEYKSPRADGRQTFVIDDALIEEFAETEAQQFDCCNPYYEDRVWGIFGEQDTLAHFEPLFLEHYTHSFHFPGVHTPTADEVVRWYVPLVEQMLERYPLAQDGARYFRHFKGGRYRYVHAAFDSETQERMVVYQALYGEGRYWVRPEKMFFETIEREGRRFARFTETAE